jgi:hypothetical protein
MPGAVKATIAIGMIVASTAVTMIGQANQAKAAKATAAYNAKLNRMDMEQNNRNRDIERAQDVKKHLIIEGKFENEDMPFDFMMADRESFEYQALVKDYGVAQRNQALEARARGGIYQGNVRAANLQTAMVGTALGGIGSAVSAGTNPKTGESYF